MIKPENKRLLELRKELGLSQEAFGNRIGLSKSGISSIENGSRNVNDKHIKLICSEFNISEIWLRKGTGNIFLESSTFSLDDFAKANNITSLEKDIIKIFMELDSSARKDLLNKMKVVFAKHLESESTLDIRPQPVAAHNDAELDDEEIKRMREDLEEL